MVQIFNDGALPFTVLPSRVAPPAWSATFVLKATFSLKPQAACTLAKKQRGLARDTPHMDAIGRSLAWSDDLVPFKPHTDFLILGSFYQPNGVAAAEGRASFVFGPLKKELVFRGPRFARQTSNSTWEVSRPEPIASVPLRWEYSFGGLSDPRNPFGKGIDPSPDANGRTVIPLPLIEDPQYPILTLRDRPPPANFAPMPAFFKARRAKLGTRDRKWSLFRAPLLPDDYDPSYHNAAPDGQQAGNYPRGDETLILRNLHPKLPELVTQLPGLRASVGALRQTPAGVLPEAIPMNLDTVVALPEEDEIVLLWRGVVAVNNRNFEDDFVWLECELEALDAPKGLPSLPQRMLARYQAGIEGGAARQQAHVAEVLKDLRKMLAKANLPPEIMKVVETETDPDKLSAVLEGHLDTLMEALKAKYPEAAAELPK